ncbi:carboxymuconolactone decarboxylase family protein [Streptomyces goshikiensis]|uniref:carboxymuconolactone decarboxylase family protein n=1 Tax=Streptomyces goshikiensis TaxID=1942 RepID=UPI0022F4058C|nr:carboxymuconolactone decarboxylase family protein [Streptomyces goshikiensis]WBY24938.1 carboxymuconolactone decarboxylase family protein [Streptomyces goshikiensis]
MPHIEINNDLPGISGLMAQRPDTGAVLSQLAETLLRSGESPLTRGERELIAAYVSELNCTRFCSASHSAFAAAQLDGGKDLVAAVLADPASAPVSPLLKALLAVAAEVQAAARPVSDEAIAAARAAGAGDAEIHDTVLIAAAFAMFNRYVNGLATEVPSDPAFYDFAADLIVNHGYGAAA